jgi:2-methylcitrate dehydratase
MTIINNFAEFIMDTTYDDLSEEVVDGTKKRILDSLGIALGSVGAEPVEIVRETVSELDPEGGACSIWGSDGAESASPPEATMLNTSLIRYLDYMDAILLPGETPHPSDNVGAAVATAEFADRSGEDLIVGVALAYEAQGEMAAKAPGRDIGWDHIHVTFGSVAAASKLLGLDYEQIRNAIGIATAASNPLRVTRTGEISMWKGIASANLARNAVYTTMLAKNGMKGPDDAFEGQKGWNEIVLGRDFQVEFTPGHRVTQVMMKKYMAGTHAQTAIEGLLEVIDRGDIDVDAIERIHLKTYESAKHVMGGGEGDRHLPKNREQADHSIPYTLAAAALDGQLMKEQYTQDRIVSEDVQSLMQTVTIEEDPLLSELFEDGKQPYIITVVTTDGGEHSIEKTSFEGHPHTPMSWESLENKFHSISKDVYDEGRRNKIIEIVKNLETYDARTLTAAL